MKVRSSGNVINLRGETAEEKELLDLMFEHGVTAFGGGAELGICCTKHFGSATPDKQIPEEEFRRIEIRVLDIDKDVVFEVSGNVNRETARAFIEGVGFDFVPKEPISRVFPQAIAMPLGKISCEQSRDCTDYPKECSKCAENRAKSYFKPKEAGS